MIGQLVTKLLMRSYSNEKSLSLGAATMRPNNNIYIVITIVMIISYSLVIYKVVIKRNIVVYKIIKSCGNVDKVGK